MANDPVFVGVSFAHTAAIHTVEVSRYGLKWGSTVCGQRHFWTQQYQQSDAAVTCGTCVRCLRAHHWRQERGLAV